MRIVAVADTHTFEEDLTVPEGDVFVHAGDMVRGGTLEELEPVARWIRSLPHRHKLVVAGNHEWCFMRQPERARAMLGAEVTYLEESGVVIDGVSFWGSPWQPAFMDWAFNLPRGEALAERWRKIPETTDVLITHCPPAGHGDRAGGYTRLGCEQLIEAVQRVQPRLHMFGHVHPAGGISRAGDTLFANVTTWECERQPTVLDIDPSTREVTPVVVPPRE